MKAETLSGQTHRNLRERLAWASAAALGAAALTFGFLLLHRENPASAPASVRFTVATPGNGSLPLFGRPTVSPDGQSVLFAVADPAVRSPVWYLYSLASGVIRAVAGVEKTTAVYWSFDSRSILMHGRLRGSSTGFWSMDLHNSSLQRLPVVGAYASWQPEGIVAGGREGVRWFRPDGSGLRWIKKREGDNGTAYSYPSLIPGGQWLMYNAAVSDGFSVHFASLDGKVDREIIKNEHPAIYTGPGYLLSRRGEMLTAQAVDGRSGKLLGARTPIVDSIGISGGTVDLLGSFSASDNGVLVFRSDVKEPPYNFTVIVNWPSLLKKK
jgi:hypothetical protein